VNFVSVCSFWTWHIILESVNKLDSNGHDYIPITVIVIVISMLNENYFSTSLFYGLETYPSRSCSNLCLSICLSVRQSLILSGFFLSVCQSLILSVFFLSVSTFSLSIISLKLLDCIFFLASFRNCFSQIVVAPFEFVRFCLLLLTAHI
jgi:hypothetical protein